MGPYSIIGPEVEIGSGTQVASQVVIQGPCRIGPDNHIHAFCSLGGDPQDKKYRPGGRSVLEIGARNVIREYCNFNRGTEAAGGYTRIGDDNWLMANVHIAHDCLIGNHTVFANHVSLAGHVEVGDYVGLGGFAGVRQFCRLGKFCFVTAASMVSRDVPPYVLVAGNLAQPLGLNEVGMQRSDMADVLRKSLKGAYRLLYRRGLRLEEALERMRELGAEVPEVRHMVDFIASSRCGIVR